MKIIIMAGGKGTRIASLNSDVPKPMIEILGKPILQYQIESLKNQGFRDFTLIVGHLFKVVTDYFGDGSKFDVHIEYIIEKEPLGTAGALYYLKQKVFEDILLINGDIMFDVDVNRFFKFHKDKGGNATILTHPNNHPYDSGIIISDEGKVINWLHKEDKRQWYQNRVNAGIHLLSPKLLNELSTLKKMDLDRDILKPLIVKGKLNCYDTPEYVKDMGTPERYEEVVYDLETNKVKSKNLLNKQKAIFLDRDGTINVYKGFLRNLDDFELMDGSAEAIQQINKRGYLVIVVTNQPVISRGEVTIEQLNEIHKKMETLLGEKGAYIDDIFYCPHHPDKGFDGEIKELKLECQCRKPKPGLLFRASEKYNIDLSQSWMIGDSECDIMAGKAAGCQVLNIKKDRNLLQCVKAIFGGVL